MENHRETISTIKVTDIKAFIKTATPSFIRSVSEILYNIIYGTFPLTDEDLLKLRKYKKVLLKLPKASDNIKRKILCNNIELFDIILSVWPGDIY